MKWISLCLTALITGAFLAVISLFIASDVVFPAISLTPKGIINKPPQIRSTINADGTLGPVIGGAVSMPDASFEMARDSLKVHIFLAGFCTFLILRLIAGFVGPSGFLLDGSMVLASVLAPILWGFTIHVSELNGGISPAANPPWESLRMIYDLILGGISPALLLLWRKAGARGP